MAVGLGNSRVPYSFAFGANEWGLQRRWHFPKDLPHGSGLIFSAHSWKLTLGSMRSDASAR